MDVVATVSSNPARMLGLADEIGALAPGMAADISVLDLLGGRFVLSDNSGEQIVTDTLLRPAFCLKGGQRFEADSPLVPPVQEAA
jgi:dihydroorotase